MTDQTGDQQNTPPETILESDQELLAVAAECGMTFSIDWLVDLSSLKPSKILKTLDDYVGRGWLIRENSIFFRFESKGRREQLRGDLSKQRRNEIEAHLNHLLLEEAENDPDTFLRHSERLLEREISFEDCHRLISAAANYSKNADDQSAGLCYQKVLTALESKSDKQADQLYVSTLIRYFNLISTGHHMPEMTVFLKSGLLRAERQKDLAGQAILNSFLANNQWQQGHHEPSRDYFEKGHEIAQELDDPEVHRHVLSGAIIYYVSRGRFREGVEFYEKRLPDTGQHSRKPLPVIANLSLAFAYNALGQAGKALGLLESISGFGSTIRHPLVTGWASTQIWETLCSIGRLDEVYRLVIDLPDEVIDNYEIRLRSSIYLLKAYILYLKKEMKQSADYFAKWFGAYEEGAYSVIQFAEYRLGFAWEMLSGRYPGVRGINFEKELDQSLQSPHIYRKGIGYRFKAMQQMSVGASAKTIKRTLVRSLFWLRKSGHQLSMVRTRVVIARYALEQQDKQIALRQALKIAKTLERYPDLPFPKELAPLIANHFQKAGLFDRIIQLNQDISTIHSGREIVRRILAAFMDTTGGERGAIFCSPAAMTELQPEATFNLSIEDIRHPDFKEVQAVMEEALAEGHGIIRRINLDEGSDFQSISRMRTCICVPMKVRSDSMGVLYADNRFLTSSFRDEELKLYSYFATQAAIAMGNAAIYDDVNQLNRKLDFENRYYRERHLELAGVRHFIGKHPAIQTVLDRVRQVARTDSTVLILGETGVGKELVAGLVMENSNRSNKPYITVNCSTFPKELISAELFGHEKGAFTGATETRVGRFELADGGTLFLDEVGDMPMDVQVKLLRVLQTHEFERVGGTQTLRSNFRLLTATNRDLRQLVEQGLFREDLYYRLNVFPIEVPPLRKRKSDIAELTRHFMSIACQKTGKTELQISEPDLKALMVHAWPGNVRELANYIERCVILSKGAQLNLSDFISRPNAGDSVGTFITMLEMEKKYILQALEKCSFKISGADGAADLLGMNPNTLYSRMKKHGIRKDVRYSSK